MTKEEILAMKPGEELDSLVACEVMGEARPESTPNFALRLQLTGSPLHSSKGNWVCLYEYSKGDIPTWHPLPFSTDIAMAWRAMQKVIEDSHCHCKIDVYSSMFAVVRFTKVREPFTSSAILACTGEEEDITSSVAICKAALLTKLEKE